MRLVRRLKLPDGLSQMIVYRRFGTLDDDGSLPGGLPFRGPR
jgi:hypothetical protein